MSATPLFEATPRHGVAQVTTANTNRDGTGAVVTIFTAGASGSKIERILAKAIATSTAGMVRIYVHDGANSRLIKELTVSAITAGAATETWEEEVEFDTPLELPTTYSIRASTHNTETFNVHVNGFDY